MGRVPTPHVPTMATTDAIPTAVLSSAAAAAVMPKLIHEAAPAPDRFARRAGPDVSIKTSDGMTQVYAVFSVDPESKELRVALVDDEGRVLRTIPPSSVAQMIQSMGRYHAA